MGGAVLFGAGADGGLKPNLASILVALTGM